MDELSETQHNDIAELLPDYAVGALDDGDLWRVETHLAGCARCQAELAELLELVGVLSPVAPPDASVKGALLRQAGVPPPPPVPSRPDTVGLEAERPRPTVPARVRPVWAALATAAVIALLVVGAWSLLQWQQLDEQRDLVALLTDPEAAYSLTDSQVETGASATFYTDDAHDQALLVARDLPPLDDGQRYQIWLFTESGERVGGGLFAPDADGSAVTVVDPAAPMSTFWAVGVSVEPAAGSDAPTSPLILGGWIQ